MIESTCANRSAPRQPRLTLVVQLLHVRDVGGVADVLDVAAHRVLAEALQHLAQQPGQVVQVAVDLVERRPRRREGGRGGRRGRFIGSLGHVGRIVGKRCSPRQMCQLPTI